MGNPTSKFEQELPENIVEDEADVLPTTTTNPIATPDSPKMGRICELLDPRSPTAEIVRTPIQVGF